MSNEEKADFWDSYKYVLTKPFSDGIKLIVDSVSPDPDVRYNAQKNVIPSLALPLALILLAITLSPLVVLLAIPVVFTVVAYKISHHPSDNSRVIYPNQTNNETNNTNKKVKQPGWFKPFIFSSIRTKTTSISEAPERHEDHNHTPKL